MSVNMPESKKKEGMMDMLSTLTGVASNIHGMAGGGGGGSGTKRGAMVGALTGTGALGGAAAGSLMDEKKKPKKSEDESTAMTRRADKLSATV